MDPLIGEIKAFAGSFAPQGWMTCSGQTLSISEYTALFSIIGTTYGGDGMQTFKLPDLRGAFPTQCSNIGGAHPGGTYNFGQTGGGVSYTITSVNLPPHTHNILKGGGTNLAGTITASAALSVNNTDTAATSTPNAGNSLSAVADLGGSGGFGIYNAQQPNTNLNSGSVTLGATSTLNFNPAGLTLTPWGSGPSPIPTVPNFVAMQYMIAVEGVYPSRP